MEGRVVADLAAPLVFADVSLAICEARCPMPMADADADALEAAYRANVNRRLQMDGRGAVLDGEHLVCCDTQALPLDYYWALDQYTGIFRRILEEAGAIFPQERSESLTVVQRGLWAWPGRRHRVILHSQPARRRALP